MSQQIAILQSLQPGQTVEWVEDWPGKDIGSVEQRLLQGTISSMQWQKDTPKISLCGIRRYFPNLARWRSLGKSRNFDFNKLRQKRINVVWTKFDDHRIRFKITPTIVGMIFLRKKETPEHSFARSFDPFRV